MGLVVGERLGLFLTCSEFRAPSSVNDRWTPDVKAWISRAVTTPSFLFNLLQLGAQSFFKTSTAQNIVAFSTS